MIERHLFEVRKRTGDRFMKDKIRGPNYFLDEILHIGEHVWPAIREDLVNTFRFPVNEVVKLDGVGSGKSTYAVLAFTYVLFLLGSCDDPAKVFGLMPGSKVALVIASLREKQAKGIIFEEIRDLVDRTPWFQRHYRPVEVTGSEMSFHNKVHVMSGSSSETVPIGYNVLLGMLDEGDWFIKRSRVGDSLDQAENVYYSLKDRIETRFGDRGLILLMSSVRVSDGFMVKEYEVTKKSPFGYVTRRPYWEAKPGRWSPYFTVNTTTARVLEHNKTRPITKTLGVLSIPELLYKSYLKNPRKFLRDRASILVTSSRSFVMRPDAFKINVERESPLTEFGTLREDFKPAPGMIYWSHNDLGITRDKLVLCAGHQEGPKTIIDLAYVVDPKEEGMANLGRARMIFFEMLKRGFRFGKVTFDQFQCSRDGTWINTQRGLVRVEEVKVGDLVQTTAGPRPVTANVVYRNAPTIKMTTEDGDVLEGTHNHPLLVSVGRTQKRGGPVVHQWGWKTLDRLTVGDVVYMVDHPTEFAGRKNAKLAGNKVELGWRKGNGKRSRIDKWNYPVEMEEPLAELLGLVWGDGTVTEDSLQLLCNESEAAEVSQVFINVFGIEPQKTPTKSGCLLMEISARWLTRWLALNGCVKPLIPDVVLQSSRLVQAAFLRGLLAADGSVDKNDGKVSLSTKSRGLVDQVRVLLRTEFGIGSHIAICRRGYPGDYVKTGVQYIVQLQGSRRKYYEQIGFTYESKMRRLGAFLDVVGRRKFSRIKEIEHAVADVYGVTVERDPSYVSNGFMSHNSRDTMQQLEARGVPVDLFSVDRDTRAYDLWMEAHYDDLIDIYDVPGYMDEVKGLVSTGKKVDHKVGGSKDITDAVAGTTFHCREEGMLIPVLGHVIRRGRDGSED